MSLVAVGTDGAPGATDEVDVAHSDVQRLADLAGPGMPYGMRRRLARARAWSDATIAESALAAWDGKGTLVIVVDRIRAADDGGVPYQLRSRAEEPVLSVVLGWTEQDCANGSLVWRPPALRATLPARLLPPEPVDEDREVVANADEE